ncbi:MAG: cytochrome D ubiquinol oxidase subunit II, partial [Nitrospinales bacterium]
MIKRNHPYKVDDPKVDSLIEELARLCSPGDHGELVREILTTAVKLALEHDDLGDFKLINTTLKEMRHALRIFSPYRNIRKAAVFGSSRTLAVDPCYSMARALSNALAA